MQRSFLYSGDNARLFLEDEESAYNEALKSGLWFKTPSEAKEHLDQGVLNQRLVQEKNALLNNPSVSAREELKTSDSYDAKDSHLRGKKK